jgi:hypothetical protein
LGTKGVQPNISLVYNSQGGVGVMGKGWNISGLLAITRSGKTFFHDDRVEGRKTIDGDGYAKLIKNSIYNKDIDEAASASLEMIQNVYNIIQHRKENLEKQKEGLTLANQLRAIDYQLKNFIEKNLIQYLAEQEFFPSGGIPVGVVEFYIGREQYSWDANTERQTKKPLSRPLHIALSEYAPGKQVVVNEWGYVSAGIESKTLFGQNQRNAIKICDECGYKGREGFYENEQAGYCPRCGHRTYYKEIVEPVAFKVDVDVKRNNRIIEPKQTARIEPLLAGMDRWEENSAAIVEIRKGTKDAEIFYLNKGKGFGYAYCPTCGRMAPKNEDGDNPLINHNYLSKRGRCRNDAANVRKVVLAGSYKTDIVELRLWGKNQQPLPEEELYTLGVIISREFAKFVGVEQQEISFGADKKASSIFIFDTAGSHGYSTQFPIYKNEVFDAALETLDGCDCETACISCLIDRETQWNEEKLNRHKAIEWLNFEKESRAELPETIKLFTPEAHRVCSDIKYELGKIIISELQELKIFVSKDISNWCPNEWHFAKSIQKMGKNVTIVMSESEIDLTALSASELTMLMDVSAKFSLAFDNSADSGVFPLLYAKFSNGKEKLYVTDSDKRDFNNEWGCNIDIYETSVVPQLQISDWQPDYSTLLGGKSNEIWLRFNTTAGKTTSRQLLVKLMEQNNERWSKIIDKIRGRTVSVTYSDRYLNSPLACRLIVDLIKSIKDKADLRISKINFNLSSNPGSKNDERSRDRKNPDFYRTDKRTEYLIKYAKEVLSLDVVPYEGYLPHARDFKFENPEFELGIYPDSGVGGGMCVDFREKDDWKDDFGNDVNVFTKGGEVYTVVYKDKTK